MVDGSRPDIGVVDDDAALAAVIDEVAAADAYAIDTEFHRERTYFAQLALVQMAWGDRIVLLDPLAVDLGPLRAVFEGPGTAVMHAARQDLEVLERSCGAIPGQLVDTQLAAGFVGYTSPSLSNLVDGELGIRLPKADRLTDWLRRPLSEQQVRYAAADVEHLLQVWAQLAVRLDDRQRMPWLREAMAELVAEPRGPRDPAECWRRIKELRHLRGRDLGVARAVAAWREEQAIELDVTPRFVLSDLGVVGVAVSRPDDVEELRRIRGVDGRALRGSSAAELIEVIREAAEHPPKTNRRQAQPELPAELRPAVPLVSAWVNQLARDLQIEGALLATRADLESLLREDPDARLATGWRAELVGEPIRRLLAGEVALAFEPRGGLVLVPRGPQAT